MYLLKRVTYDFDVNVYSNSHSTMYLLKHIPIEVKAFCQIYSHSTMYLLKPNQPQSTVSTKIEFTFHHVSIKTVSAGRNYINDHNSHSTMYLLKPNPPITIVSLPEFTFHHVSIKTV